jgi:hypothetical protein
MPRALLTTLAVLTAAALAPTLLSAGESVLVHRKPGDTGELHPVRLLADLPAAAHTATPAPRGLYGGDTRTTRRATGFFRIEKPTTPAGRWWLIDPDGHPFYNIGLAVVQPKIGASKTALAARRAKYGDEAAWAAAVTDELRALGFNGTGAWSSDAILREAPRPLPYTVVWNFMSEYGRHRGGTYQLPGHTGYPENAIFVFDPGFEAFCEKHAAKLASTRDDPYLLGHFSDNELPFRGNSLDNFLKLPPDEPGGRAARDWLAARRAKASSAAKAAEPTADERDAFLELVAERYFSIVSAAIRRHDPNHLYLGSRIHGQALRQRGPWVAAGRHVDLIAANIYYMWTPNRALFAQWAGWSGKPFLVTEWYAKGMDSGLPNTTGAGWTVATQAERGKFYQHFTLGLLETPTCVGWHWFRYTDNDPGDLTTDPSNRDSNKGLVNIRYEPYAPLADAMRPVNERVYRLIEYFDSLARL